jgi:hypothetical protein
LIEEQTLLRAELGFPPGESVRKNHDGSGNHEMVRIFVNS